MFAPDAPGAFSLKGKNCVILSLYFPRKRDYNMTTITNEEKAI
jgi:hypothetical protein